MEGRIRLIMPPRRLRQMSSSTILSSGWAIPAFAETSRGLTKRRKRDSCKGSSPDESTSPLLRVSLSLSHRDSTQMFITASPSTVFADATAERDLSSRREQNHHCVPISSIKHFFDGSVWYKFCTTRTRPPPKTTTHLHVKVG